MLYQILPGACDQSFGIQVAQSANFPPQVVAAAKEKLAQLEDTEAEGLRVSCVICLSQGRYHTMTVRGGTVVTTE
jgi:DNA mismatch repair ATPase MutS